MNTYAHVNSKSESTHRIIRININIIYFQCHMASLCFGSLLFSSFFVYSFVLSLFTLSATLLQIHFTFPRLDKRILVSHLSCLRWRTLISSLFTAFVSSLHRFRDCLRLPAPAVPFGMSKNEFSSLLSLVSSSRPFLPFSVGLSIAL